MSEPWPPAFMRTRAADRAGHADRPLEPGEPGGGGPPGQHRQGDGRRRRAPAVPSMSIASRELAPSDDGDAGKPASATSRLEPRPTTSTGSADAARSPAATGAGRRPSRRGRTAPRGPPTRYVVTRPSGSSHGDPRAAPRSAAARRRTALGERSAATSPRRVSTARSARRASTSSGSVAMSPQPIEMHTSPGRSSPGEVRRPGRRGGQPHHACRRVGVEHGVDDELARHAGDRRRAGGVDVGEHDDVGVDERVAVLGRHHGHAVEAVGLEDGHDPPPAVAAARARRASTAAISLGRWA